MKPSLQREIAVRRFHNGGPDLADRLERSAIEGIKAGDRPKVRRTLKLRLSRKLKPDAAKQFQIDRILLLIDEAEQRGIAGTGEFAVSSS